MFCNERETLRTSKKLRQKRELPRRYAQRLGKKRQHVEKQNNLSMKLLMSFAVYGVLVANMK